MIWNQGITTYYKKKPYVTTNTRRGCQSGETWHTSSTAHDRSYRRTFGGILATPQGNKQSPTTKGQTTPSIGRQTGSVMDVASTMQYVHWSHQTHIRWRQHSLQQISNERCSCKIVNIICGRKQDRNLDHMGRVCGSQQEAICRWGRREYRKSKDPKHG